MHPPTNNYCCAVEWYRLPVVVARLKKNAMLENFGVYKPNQKRKAGPAAVTAAAYAIAAALLALLCCCCCDTLIIWARFVFRLCRFAIVIPVVPAVARKMYVRKTTVLEK